MEREREREEREKERREKERREKERREKERMEILKHTHTLTYIWREGRRALEIS